MCTINYTVIQLFTGYAVFCVCVCRPDLTRRIGLACAVMTSLKRIWSDKRLTFDTKLRIYQTMVFTARCYASTILAMALCPSVCPSVRLSQVGVLLKRLNVASHKQHHRIAQGSSLLTPKISAKFDRGHPLRGRQMQVGWVKIGDF